MQPFKLVREGTEQVIAQACSKCGRVYTLGDGYAERCCDPRCADCNVALPPKSSWTCCDECRGKRDAARMQERVAKAKRIPEAEYTGPLYVDDSSCGRDGFFDDMGDLRERYEDEEQPLPAVAWACFEKRFAIPSADEIVDSECQNGEHYDDIADSLTDTAELQLAIDAWNARQTATSWEPDYSTMIVLGTTTHPERAPVLAVDPASGTRADSRSTPDDARTPPLAASPEQTP